MGKGSRIFKSNTYSLHCHYWNDCIKEGSRVSHFNAKSRDSVHKPQFLKRKKSRSGSNRGPSAYQPVALPLGHAGSPTTERKQGVLRPQKPLRLIRDGEVGGGQEFYI